MGVLRDKAQQGSSGRTHLFGRDRKLLIPTFSQFKNRYSVQLLRIPYLTHLSAFELLFFFTQNCLGSFPTT